MSNTNKKLRTCVLCHTTGKKGAQFVLLVDKGESRVHKHCGNVLLKQAPPGTSARLVHWADLRREQEAAKREAEQSGARAFWGDKFPQLQALASSPPTLVAAE